MALKILKNKTNVAQGVVHNGKQIILKAKEERAFDDVIASAFIAECSPFVVEVSPDVGAVQTDKEATTMVWIANFTGNPDAPESFKRRKWDGREYVETTVPNDLREPRPLIRFMDLGMQEYTNKDGVLEALNLPKVEVRIDPYKRKEMPKNTAAWFINRDAVQDKYNRGACGLSRPPTPFEPTFDWDLDDMRTYLKLADPNATLGPTEKEAAAARPGDEEAAIQEAKLVCLRRLFFRVANPDYRLPTKREFDEFKAASKSVVEAHVAVAQKPASTQQSAPRR